MYSLPSFRIAVPTTPQTPFSSLSLQVQDGRRIFFPGFVTRGIRSPHVRTVSQDSAILTADDEWDSSPMHHAQSKIGLLCQHEYFTTRTFASRYRSFVIFVVGVLFIFGVRQYYHSDSYRDALIRIAQLRLHELNQVYNPNANRADLNLDIGNAATIDLASYSQRLLATSRTIMGRSYRRGPSKPLRNALSNTANALMLHEGGALLTYENRSLGESLGHRIVTNQRNKSELFKEAPFFEVWGKQNPEWGYSVYDDADMAGWLENHASATALQEAFHELPRDVMRSDLFRYLSIFQGGGLYADTFILTLYH